MQFVRNGYQFNKLPNPWERSEVLKHIECIGRLCYRSDDKITDESAPKFIGVLKSRKHWAMLEHYIFTMSIPKSVYDSILDPKNFVITDEIDNSDYIDKIKFVNITHFDQEPWSDYFDPRTEYLISGSATAFNYLWACNCVRGNPNHGIYQVCKYLQSHIPELMFDPNGNDPLIGYQINKGISFLSREEVRGLPKSLRMLHDWFSVHLVVERSSTHDLVRHRPQVSYAQESTRYCNYDKKGMCFVIPCQFYEEDKVVLENHEYVQEMLKHIDDDNNIYDLNDDAWEWFKILAEEAARYGDFINEFKWVPQEAKSILGHALRAEINITTFKNHWYHIFNMRADKAAFPQIQEVMVPLLKDAIGEDPEIFSSLQSKVDEGSKFIHE